MNHLKSLRKTLYLRILVPYLFIIFSVLIVFFYFQNQINRSDKLILDAHSLADVAYQQQVLAEKVLLLTDIDKKLEILGQFEFNKSYIDKEMKDFKEDFEVMISSDVDSIFAHLDKQVAFLSSFVEDIKNRKEVEEKLLLENSEDIYLNVLKLSGVVIKEKNNISNSLLIVNLSVLFFFSVVAFFLTSKMVNTVLASFNYVSTFAKKFGIHKGETLDIVSPEYFEIEELQSAIISMKERVLLQARVAQQENTSKTIGELAENLAHLINNPLSIIASSARILQKKVKENTLVQEEAESIVECVNRITQTSLSMKKLINSESKDMVSYFNVLNVKYGIELFFLNKFLENNIKLIFDINEDIRIYARENEILQVVFTLVENSIDFLKDFEDEATKWIKISAAEGAKDNTVLLIEDGGVILDENIIYSSMMSQGKSVGLYSVSQTINKNLGSIEFISKPNTRFIINLPSRSIFD